MKIDRPSSIPVKDYLYKTLALRLNIHSQIIEKIIDHSFKSAHEALKQTNHSVEIAGFGKFLFNKKKALRKLNNSYDAKRHLENKLLEPIDEKEVAKLTKKLNIANEIINQLEPKLHGEIK